MFLGRARKNEPDSEHEYEKLQGQYRAMLFGHLLRMLRNRDDAEEALVETFARIWKGLSNRRHDDSERAWVMTVATNVGLKQIARTKRRRELLVEPSNEDESAVDWALDPDPGPEQALNVEFVDLLLERIPEPRRTALRLRVGHEFTDEEVARIVGVPVGTVKSWIFRDLARLRRIASEQLHEEVAR